MFPTLQNVLSNKPGRDFYPFPSCFLACPSPKKSRATFKKKPINHCIFFNNRILFRIFFLHIFHSLHIFLHTFQPCFHIECRVNFLFLKILFLRRVHRGKILVRRGQIFVLCRMCRGQIFILRRVHRGQIFILHRVHRGQIFVLRHVRRDKNNFFSLRRLVEDAMELRMVLVTRLVSHSSKRAFKQAWP